MQQDENDYIKNNLDTFRALNKRLETLQSKIEPQVLQLYPQLEVSRDDKSDISIFY